MANAFGFNRHPQRGTPDPTQVGQALMRRRRPDPDDLFRRGGRRVLLGNATRRSASPDPTAPEGSDAFHGAAPPYAQDALGRPSVEFASDHTPFGEFGTGQFPDEMMRDEGARLMTSGQGDNSALAAAIGEALTREGGGFQGNPNPMKPTAEHMRRLQHLGLSETEAMLLGLTGGV